MTVKKAIVPVGGLGTRFLPATKSIPKEVLTLVDRPVIQYAIDEAREAGIQEFIFVTAKGKTCLEDYFDRAPELERRLEERGDYKKLALLAQSSIDEGAISYVRQGEPLGLGHAVWCARRLIGDEPFAVILPDDVIIGDKPCLGQMLEAHRHTGGCVLAAMDVRNEDTPSYGIMDVEAEIGQTLRLRGIVEKPKLGTAPSNLAVIGRYILTPNVLRYLAHQTTGVGGEIQITDAISEEIAAGHPVHGLKFKGERFDCGSKLGFLKASLYIGLSHQELQDDLMDYVQVVARSRRAAA